MNNVNITQDELIILIIRLLACVLFPPLAVIDKGCGAILLVLLCTLLGWIPGTILALYFCLKNRP